MRFPGIQIGSCSGGPLFSRFRLPGVTQEVRDEVYGSNFMARVDYFDDFFGDTLDAALNARDTSAAGTPTQGLVADAHQLEVVLAATNEVETVGYDFGDQRNFPANKRPVFSARFKLPVMVAANERFVIGLVSDYNATLDSTTLNFWLRLEGGSTVYLEADDNVTNTDDQAATGITSLTADTWYTTHIDLCSQPGYASYYLNTDGSRPRYLGRIACGDVDATTLQPVILLQKDSGTGVPAFKLDWWRVRHDRF